MNHRQNAHLLKRTRKYIRKVFRKKRARVLLFHNRTHIGSVVKIAYKMARKYSLNADDHLVLLLSAWFHNVGYISKTSNYENGSAERAEKFLKKRRVRNDIIERVKATIQSTAAKHQPTELIEQILADADQFYLGRKKFLSNTNLLRKEHEWLEGKKISKETWYKRTIDFIQSHSFHTEYAREHLANGVSNNLAKLIDKLPQPDQQLAKVKPFI